MARKILLISALILGNFLTPVRATAGDRSPFYLLINMSFYGGEEDQSIAGALGYGVTFKTQTQSGFFRPSFGILMNYSVGEINIAGASPSFDMFGGFGLFGLETHFFKEGRVLPFFGGSGIVGWNLMRIGSAPTGIDSNSQAIAYGYEITAGADIRLGAIDGNAWRIQTSYVWTKSNLANQSNFQVNSFKIEIGIRFAR